MTNLSRAEEQRIDDKIQRGIREYLKNGMPPGTYGSYQWDGYRIVGGGAGGGLIARAHCSSDVALNPGTIRVDFDFVDYDPQSTITTGASWAFTAPADGWYRFEPLFTIAGDGNVFDHGDFVATIMYRGNSFISFIDQANWFIDTDLVVSFALLGSAYTLEMAAGQLAHVKLESNGGTAHIVSVNDGGGIIAISQVA